MKRLFAKRWVRRSLGTLLALTLAPLAVAAYCGVWSKDDFKAFVGMCTECHPVWRDLHWGRIRAGQDVEEVIAKTRPTKLERYGDFVDLHYFTTDRTDVLHFTGVRILARNGRLAGASAWSCTWHRSFFDELGEAGWDRAHHEWRAGLGRQRVSEELTRVAERLRLDRDTRCCDSPGQ
jgi:hypothetical protein